VIPSRTSRFRRGRVPNGTAAVRVTAYAGACNQSDSRSEAPLRKPWNKKIGMSLRQPPGTHGRTA